jgi:predicted sulfurtransferase/predicted O-methyltransferase YrrM
MMIPSLVLPFRISRSKSTKTRRFLIHNNNTPRRQSRQLPVVVVESSSWPHNQTRANILGNDGVAAAIPRSNQELVQRRLEVARHKRQARHLSSQQDHARNLQLKSLLGQQQQQHEAVSSRNQTKSSSASSLLYALKVSVCDQLRQELKLSGRERRGRVFVSSDSAALHSLTALSLEIQASFRALRKHSYCLYAGLPVLQQQQQQQDPHVVKDAAVANTLAAGTTSSSSSSSISSGGSNNETATFWKIELDEDVVKTFHAAHLFFQQHAATFKRPVVVIHVQKDPNAVTSTSPWADYWNSTNTNNMPDPADSPTYTMLSFYSFPPSGITDPDNFAAYLKKVWKPFQALGRVYVAPEGVNAQMSVPTTVVPHFTAACRFIFDTIHNNNNNNSNGDHDFCCNMDPIPVPRTSEPPFVALHIRVRRQIVADGLDSATGAAYDWQSAGYEMQPLEWHETLLQQQQQQESTEKMILLDCRNIYETDVGRFEGAEPLGTENFRDSWTVLNDRLKETARDTPIYTYCTGGIRCVKVGAYLTQELGFTNVSRLAGGIVAYDRTLGEQGRQTESLFKGTNFVFDGRLGRAITDDALGTCVSCGDGKKTSLVSNCRNENCHKRIIQCENCRSSMLGTCSDPCRQRLLNAGAKSNAAARMSKMIPRRQQEAVPANSGGGDIRGGDDDDESIAATTTKSRYYSSLDEYSQGHSSPTPLIYAELELNTRALMPSGSHMVSGGPQGRFLTQLASLTREGRILEVGTFTGYATACLLEGAAHVGRVVPRSHRDDTNGAGSRQGGPYVMTMERDARAFDVAVAHLKCLAEYGGTGKDVVAAMRALREDRGVPVVDADLVSLDYQGLAGCELVRVSDALAILESMAAGTSTMLQPAPFDMVFVDADKTRLLEYVEACLSSDRVLKPGGLIVVDNVLWKGLVLEAHNGCFSSLLSNEDYEDGQQVRKNRRARKLANKMHRFNSEIVKDHRAEVLVLPVRDGLSLIRKT